MGKGKKKADDEKRPSFFIGEQDSKPVKVCTLLVEVIICLIVAFCHFPFRQRLWVRMTRKSRWKKSLFRRMVGGVGSSFSLPSSQTWVSLKSSLI